MTAESMVMVNLFIFLICVWVAMVINSKFLRPAILNRKRFAVYELRDRLAILAMKGVIDQKSEEYITLSRLMNNCLSSTKGFSITHFLRVQSKIITDERLREHLDSILKKIKNQKMPNEYRAIVAEFFNASHEIYEHKTWMLLNILTPLIFVVGFFSYGIKALKKGKLFLIQQKDKINSIENELEENANKFAI